jgi:hypothetical protein
MLNFKFLFFFSIVCLSISSSTKDKTPVPPVPPEPTRWEKIAGNYKVYDTLGMYLYDMEIVHTNNDVLKKDTFIFFNLHNQFNLFSNQPYIPPSSDPYRIVIGPEDPIYDKQNKRWDLFPFGEYPTEGFNVWKNDTIRIKYRLTNIKYWIEDAVPYSYKIVKEIAVKQH